MERMKPLHCIEHGLGIHASYVIWMDAKNIYDEDRLKPHMKRIEKSHIYMVGYMDDHVLVSAIQKDNVAIISVDIGGIRKELEMQIPKGCSLSYFSKDISFIDPYGREFFPRVQFDQLLSEHITFDVRYVGKSYGKNGSSNSRKRLLQHSKLQEIAIKNEAPSGKHLSLLMLEVAGSAELFTRITGDASDFQKDNASDRMTNGLSMEKLTEEELVCLYEAAMIRYFSPQFNKEFKNTFPSTDLKLLNECYKKDISQLFAEISIENLPFKICSELRPAWHEHLAAFALHTDERRKVFFNSAT